MLGPGSTHDGGGRSGLLPPVCGEQWEGGWRGSRCSFDFCIGAVFVLVFIIVRVFDRVDGFFFFFSPQAFCVSMLSFLFFWFLRL